MARRKLRRESRKKDTEREVKTLLIICESSKTARLYFRKFEGKRYYIRVEAPKSKCNDPLDLINFAINQAEKNEINFSKGDRVWCLLDIDLVSDEKNPDLKLKKARQLAERKKIRIALSNPCFELWYLLHYEYTAAFLPNHETVINRLRRHLPDYQKSKCDFFEELATRRKHAIMRAKGLNEFHQEWGKCLDSRESNPATQVFELIEFIENINSNI